MAVVRSVSLNAPSTRRHPTEVDLEIRKVLTASGETFIQLTSFGSDVRISEPKPSQTLQFDLDGARALLEEVKRTFPEIVN